MKKQFILLFISLSCISAIAQNPTPPSADPSPSTSNFTQRSSSFKDKLFTGGDFSLQFGSQTYVQIAPLLGYRVTDQFSVGITGKYIYFKYTDPNPNSDYTFKTNMYGGGVFNRYNITEEIFLHAEYEALSREIPTSVFSNQRRIVSALFLGGGYRQFLGEYSSLNLMILFDAINDPYSIYENPIIRVGFDFGL